MRSSIYRVLLMTFVLLAVAAGPLQASSQGLKGVDDEESSSGHLDLSAMMLTPLDLAEAGLEGYGLRSGATDTFDDEFVDILSSDGFPPREVRDILEDAGFVQSRWAEMDLPSEENPDQAARRVTIYLDEYTGDEGLDEAIDLYLDLGGEDVEGTETFGDETRLTTYTYVTSDTGVDATALVIAFAYENQIAQIEIVDFETQLPDLEPTVEEIETLAELQLERIEEVREDGSAAIEHLTLRFESDGEFVFYIDDYYTRLDDQSLPRYGLSAAVEAGEEFEQEFGITDAYRMRQAIGFNGDVAVVWNNQIRRFEEEDDAEKWIDSAEEWFDIFGTEDFEIVDDDLDLGDHAIAATMNDGAEGAAVSWHSVLVLVQVDDLVMVVLIDYPNELVDLDIVLELAELQVEMVENGGPIESPLPDSLIDLAGTL